MKKLLLLLFLLIPFNIQALTPNYEIDGLYINADVYENGDMLVKEQIVVNGDFNGYTRDLFYKGNYQLYDASEIIINKVCELSNEKRGLFDIKDNDLICFNEVNNADLGDSYVYIRTDSNDNTTLKMFNYTSNNTKIFYIEYLLKNVVVIHNDVAELYYTFIGDNFDDDINDVKIEINLPSKANDLRVWAHGPLTGNINKENNQIITATITNLYKNNLVDIRSTFDKNIINNGTKLSNKDAFDDILKEEQERADIANKERKRDQLIVNGLLALNWIWLSLTIFLFIYIYLKYDREYKSDFKLEYYRDFPGKYGPSSLEYLLKRNITTLSLSATILDIIRKKGLEVSQVTKKDYTLIKKEDNKAKLSKEETYVLDWLINDIGDGKEVSLSAIKKISKNNNSAKSFVDKYQRWVNLEKTKAQSLNFYEDNLMFKMIGGLIAILGIVLIIISFNFGIQNNIVIITTIMSILLLIYVISFKKRTLKGNEDYVKWKAFKKFLLNFGRFRDKELPEIVLWEKYLVYATIFGIADRVSKVMEIKVKEVDPNATTFNSNLFYNYYFTSSLVKTIDTTRSASLSQVAASTQSSGAGFGGGFSGGGGFGGGGTGGGGRGF